MLAKTALLLSLAAVFVLFQCSSSTKTDGGKPAASGGDTAATAAPAAAAKVGDAVKVGEEATWTVTKVTDLGQELKSDNQFIDPVKTTGRFLQVDATIKAEGKDGYVILSNKVKDDQGREFDTKTEAMTLVEGESCLMKTVNPGLEQACVFVYELPADAKGLTFMAPGGMLDKDVPISLGQ